MTDITNAAENPIKGVPAGMTPEEYFSNPDLYKPKTNPMGLGIVIENYSKYNLMFPTINFEDPSQATTEVKDVNSRLEFVKRFDFQVRHSKLR